MNKSKRLFGLFNILDLALVLFVILAAVGVIFKGDILDRIRVSSNDIGIEFTVRLENVRAVTRDSARVGDVVYDTETGMNLGTITRVSSTPYYKDYDTDYGTIELAEVPERYLVYITVEGSGKETDSGFYIGGSRYVAPNCTILIGSPKLNSSGIVTFVREID